MEHVNGTIQKLIDDAYRLGVEKGKQENEERVKRYQARFGALEKSYNLLLKRVYADDDRGQAPGN